MDGYVNLLDLSLVERFAFAWHKMVEGRRNPIREGHYRTYYINEEGRFQCEEWLLEDWWPSQFTEHVYGHMLLLHRSAKLRERRKIPHRHQGAERLFAALALAYSLVAVYKLMLAARNPGCHLGEILFLVPGFVQIDHVFARFRARKTTSMGLWEARRR